MNSKKQKYFTPSNKKSAFNFIELAIAILIISVLVGGVLAGFKIIDKSRIATARNLTKNSPVNMVDSLFAWYETTLSDSLLQSENEEGLSLSEWKDIKISSIAVNATQSNGSYQPEFSGKINHLTSVKFDGTGKYFNVNAANLNNADYTIIVVEKRSSGDSDNYFIGDSSITQNNENILLGYSSSGEVTHGQGGSNSYTSAVSSYSDSNGVARVFTFIQKSSLGKKTYINGYLAGESSDTSRVRNLSNLVIGKDYNGEVGEVIVYNKALSNEERKVIEKYLGQKWSVKITESSTSCTNGIITGSGCEIACSVTIDGVSTPTSVPANSSGNFTCNALLYNDIIPYSCSIDGTLDIGGEICDVCTSGYSYYNSTCQGPCLTSGITGVTNGTSVSAGANSTSCNSAGYTGSVAGICDSETFTLNSGQSCECATGYERNDSGACVASCTGGVKTTYTDGGGVKHTVHTFNTVGNSGQFSCPDNRNIDILVVGGGGSSCYDGEGSGGGGGGGVVYKTGLSVTASTNYTVTVGGGGIMGSNAAAGKGGSSKFSSVADIIVAQGGARSGCYKASGSAGGSGSGSGRDSNNLPGGTVVANTTAGGTSYGNAGGKSTGGAWCGGGGGGGAGGAGGNGTCYETGGAGGNGVQIAISGVSPTPYYGAGGGGSTQYYGTVGLGGSHGYTGAGGKGARKGTDWATSGANGYGSGGGGCANANEYGGGNGGSGTVIISY